MSLIISQLKVSIEGKEILKGIDLEVGAGQLHILMGPNGSGKSTLAQVIAGHPSYTINDGRLTMNGKDIAGLSPDRRARLGIFLAFQHPVEIPGVSVFNVLRRAKQVFAGPAAEGTSTSSVSSRRSGNSFVGGASFRVTRKSAGTNGEGKFNAKAFREELVNYLSTLRLSEDFLRRSLNEGFSGGEKKRSEILQMMALKPKLVILDEIDSGLDVDALKVVSSSMNRFIRLNPKSSVLLITHYARILKYLKPDFVHVMVDGRIIKSGKLELAKLVEEKGYRVWQTV